MNDNTTGLATLHVDAPGGLRVSGPCACGGAADVGSDLSQLRNEMSELRHELKRDLTSRALTTDLEALDNKTGAEMSALAIDVVEQHTALNTALNESLRSHVTAIADSVRPLHPPTVCVLCPRRSCPRRNLSSHGRPRH